jgi:hypothetical protein
MVTDSVMTLPKWRSDQRGYGCPDRHRGGRGGLHAHSPMLHHRAAARRRRNGQSLDEEEPLPGYVSERRERREGRAACGCSRYDATRQQRSSRLPAHGWNSGHRHLAASANAVSDRRRSLHQLDRIIRNQHANRRQACELKVNCRAQSVQGRT